MSCMYDELCKYYEDGHCDFPCMGSGYPYDAPCFCKEDDWDWVPCSEKPYPDTDGRYLITVCIGDSVFVDASHFINIDGSIFWVDHDYNLDEVIAWMPAMEPYKGG